jgi:riboflavin kinase, archaea type
MEPVQCCDDGSPEVHLVSFNQVWEFCSLAKNMLRLRGKVVSGRADFGQWIERLSTLYERKTGMLLYPGTLNVELPSEYSLPADVTRLEADEYCGTVSVSIVPCRIFDRQAFLLRTDENERGTGHHPRNIVEIATDVRLRDLYGLSDGDWVEIEIP